MNKKTLSYFIHFLILLFFIVPLFSCETKNHEDLLLKYFKEELSLIKKHKKNYLLYMETQIQSFPKKQKQLTKLFQKINDRFDKMSLKEKLNYQNKWKILFQPVVNAIYLETQTMIREQKKALSSSPKNLAKIQELNIKMELLEKQTPYIQLKPSFFKPYTEDHKKVDNRK